MLSARNIELWVCNEIVLILSLIQQSLEERMVEQRDLDHISLVMLSHVHNQMTLWHIVGNIAFSFIVHGWPHFPFAAVIVGTTVDHSTPNFLPLVKTPSQKLPLHSSLEASKSCVCEREKGRWRKVHGVLGTWKDLYNCGMGSTNAPEHYGSVFAF